MICVLKSRRDQRDALSRSVSQHLADRSLPVPPGLMIVAYTSVYQDVSYPPLMRTLGVLYLSLAGRAAD